MLRLGDCLQFALDLGGHGDADVGGLLAPPLFLGSRHAEWKILGKTIKSNKNLDPLEAGAIVYVEVHMDRMRGPYFGDGGEGEPSPRYVCANPDCESWKMTYEVVDDHCECPECGEEGEPNA